MGISLIILTAGSENNIYLSDIIMRKIDIETSENQNNKPINNEENKIE